MTTYSAKSSSGRTEWTLINGRLKEVGSDTYTFTLSATDTLILLKLLRQGVNEIIYAAGKDKSINVSDDAVLVDNDGEPKEQGSHAVSSVEIDDGLRDKGLFKTVEPGRGA
jgi:hypothetical protein